MLRCALCKRSPAGPHLRRDSLPVCVGPIALGIGLERRDACEVAVAEADDADEEKVHHDDQDERHADQRDCTAGSATARPVQSATAVSSPQYSRILTGRDVALLAEATLTASDGGPTRSIAGGRPRA